MPRGVRKLGQYKCTVWTPGGARIEWSTTKDKSREEHVADLRDLVERLKNVAAAIESQTGA